MVTLGERVRQVRDLLFPEVDVHHPWIDPQASAAHRVSSTTPIMETTFGSHLTRPGLVTEGKGNQSSAATASRALTLAGDEERYGTFREGALSEHDRKDMLLHAYLTVPWISTCVEVIARRLVSGGLTIEKTGDEDGSAENYQTLQTFWQTFNDQWDFRQFIYTLAVDLLMFGETYIEMVRVGGQVVRLYKMDCLTMSTKSDRHGNPTQYVQTLPNQSDPISFQPEDMIRIWFPHPRSTVKALSPLERVIQNAYSYRLMVDCQQNFFRRGAKHPYHVDFGTEEPDEAERMQAKYIEMNTGKKNLNAPVFTYGGTTISDFGKGNIDVDFQNGLKMERDAILAGYGVPPAMASIIESGNIGGGTGESQEEAFLRNTVDPVKEIIFEKLNFGCTRNGLNITDWRVSTRYADYRDKDVVAKIQDMRIRNGSLMINEARTEAGRPPIEGGDVAIVVTTKEITPVPRLEDIEDEQRQVAQLDLQTKQAQADQAEAQAKIAKQNAENPQPAIHPAVLAALSQGQAQPGKSAAPTSSQGKGKDTSNDSQNTGQEQWKDDGPFFFEKANAPRRGGHHRNNKSHWKMRQVA